MYGRCGRRQTLLRVLTVIGPVALMLILACTPGISFSEDLGRHLLLGRIISEQHSVPESMGCLLGVSMAQFRTTDAEMAEVLRRHIKGVEEAFYKAFKRAQDVGELDGNTNIRDLARLYMGIAQGLALIGRVQDTPAVPRSIVNAALTTLKTV